MADAPVPSSTPGEIITFYSYKGGVGRSMALANIAVLLARMGKRVLCVDFDLEAPGLDRYFTAHRSAEPRESDGLLGLLHAACSGAPATDFHARVATITCPDTPPLMLLQSGQGGDNYARRLGEFSWEHFFAKHEGGAWIEALREAFAAAYDFILLDSRTGVTDSGGVCTIQLPDLLVAVCAANDQNLAGTRDICAAIHTQRARLPFDRPRLRILPILSRFDGDKETKLAEKWLGLCAETLGPLMDDWLAKPRTALDHFVQTKLPHIARYSFGEQLAVLEERADDPQLLHFYYAQLADLLSRDLAPPAPHPAEGDSPPAEALQLLRDIERLRADPTALDRELRQAELDFGEGEALVRKMNEATYLLSHLGRYSEAESMAHRAFSMGERVLGPEHLRTLTSINNLAGLLEKKGDLSGAEQLHRRALETRERLLGPEHPDTLITVSNLATLLEKAGNRAAAESLLRRAWETRERTLGPDHPSTLTSINNLAHSLTAQGDHTGAEPLFRRALAARERVLGPDHPDTLTSVNNLAYLLNQRGNLKEAEQLFRRALAGYERVFGPDHPTALRSANNLAYILDKNGDLAGAESLYRRALEVRERAFGPTHPDTLRNVDTLAVLLDEKGDAEGTEVLLRRALASRERELRPGHPNICLSAYNLAAFLVKQGRREEVGSLAQQAYDGWKATFGEEHERTKSAAELLRYLNEKP